MSPRDTNAPTAATGHGYHRATEPCVVREVAVAAVAAELCVAAGVAAAAAHAGDGAAGAKFHDVADER